MCVFYQIFKLTQSSIFFRILVDKLIAYLWLVDGGKTRFEERM